MHEDFVARLMLWRLQITQRQSSVSAAVKMKKEEGGDHEDQKEREDSGELSDYPLSKNKRARKVKTEEEGDWIPPKKVGRGPGNCLACNHRHSLSELHCSSGRIQHTPLPEMDVFRL